MILRHSDGRLRYTLKRLGLCLVSMFLIANAVFLLVQVIPGNAFIQFGRTNADVIAAMKAKYGLDQPLFVQYIKYLGRLFRFDLGISSSNSGASVNEIVMQAFPVSLRIAFFGTFFGAVLGVLVAGISALSRNRMAVMICKFFTLLGMAASAVIIAPILQYVFGVKLRILPIALLTTPLHYVLPVLTLALVTMSMVAYVGADALREAGNSTYAFVARCKGFSETKVFFCYLLRNAGVPFLNITALCFAANTVGSILVESVYSIPGLGNIMMAAVSGLDYGLIMGLTVFLGAFFIAIIFITDMLCALIDPRIILK